jgi:hypothetical protein
VSEQLKALVTCDDPQSPLMMNMFHGRLGYEVLQVSMGKKHIDTCGSIIALKKILNIAVLLRLLVLQHFFAKP